MANGYPDTYGSARNSYNSGRSYNAGAWGGYSGEYNGDLDKKGNYKVDTTKSGRAVDASRYETMAQWAPSTEAYRNDYSQADAQAANAQQSRSMQDAAIARMQLTAANGSDATRALGQSMIQQGLNSQRAAGMSARGGSMAQIAALRQSMPGQIAYQQQAGQQMAATQADEMAAARQELAAALAQQRQQDYQGAQAAQNQALAQQQNELQQRQLNQQRQQAYEQMAYDTNNAAANAEMSRREIGAGIYNTQQGNDASDFARQTRLVGAGISTLGSVVAMSDVRSKRAIRSMADVAALRRGT